MKNKYKKDYFPLKGALIATVVCSGISLYGLFLCAFLEKGLEAATQTKAIDPLLECFPPYSWPFIAIAIFIFGYIMLNYLHAGWENGIFGLPDKKGYDYKKIPI